MHLPESFYQQQDVTGIARQLIGKVLLTFVNRRLTGGIILETEAYNGIHDKASHAWNNRRTARTECMYAQGGVAYVYLCYGMHHLFNVVTNINEVPDAVLIRGFKPVFGLQAMSARAGYAISGIKPVFGPGRLSTCLGISIGHNREKLTGDTIWMEDWGLDLDERIEATPRIGIAYAGEDAGLRYRFVVASL